jgi:hypothetical protein
MLSEHVCTNEKESNFAECFEQTRVCASWIKSRLEWKLSG